MQKIYKVAVNYKARSIERLRNFFATFQKNY